MQDAPKVDWSIPYISVAFFPSLKHNFIAYRSSKVSDCIVENHQLWQSGFSRVYSNSCCSCSFAPEIIRIGQSSHKMYSNHHHHHVVPLAWISLTLATSPYHSSLLAGLQGYIPYPHIAAVCMFELVVLLLLGHMQGSIGVHHWWVRPWFSSSVLRVWLV